MEANVLMSLTPTIRVFAPGRTARHEAAFTWVLSSALGLDWTWAEEGVDQDGIHCHYGGGHQAKGMALPVDGLLSEVGQRRAEPPGVDGPDADLFAAVFWMASRMEEHLPGALRDDHGRFDPSGSIAERKGWLDVPICEHWAFRVGERLLGAHWPAHRENLLAKFEVVPTIDVDSAYAFRGKGGIRTTGALVRDFAQGRFSRGQTNAGHFEARFRSLRHLFQSAEMAPRPGASSPVVLFCSRLLGPMTRGCRHPVLNSAR